MLRLQRRQVCGYGATWIVGPAGAEVVAFAEVVGGLVDQAAGLDQVGGGNALLAYGVAAPAAQMHQG